MKTRQGKRSAWLLGAVGSLAATLSAACNLDESGVPPPPGKLAYPIAVALSREPTPSTLFVANSNFDLTYSAGSVQAYDLTQLEAQFERCRNVDDLVLDDAGTVVPDRTTYLGIDGGAIDAGSGDSGPGPALADGGMIVRGMDGGTISLRPRASGRQFVNPEGSLCDESAHVAFDERGCCLVAGEPTLDRARQEVSIDSFATALAISADSRRLYVPISSRSRLVYLDIDQGRLSCGEDGDRCTRGPGRGRSDEVPDQNFPGQPMSIAVGTLGDLGITDQALAGAMGKSSATPVVLTAHELGGLSLFVESGPPGSLQSAPVLESVQENRLREPTSVTVDAQNKFVYVTTARDNAAISRFSARLLPQADVDGAGAEREPGPRELLYQTNRILISGVAAAEELRDIAVDPDDPSRLFALTRGSPQAVVFLRLERTSPLLEARVVDAERVGAGPSKLRYVKLGDRPFLLVSAYDARAITIIDANTRRTVAEVRNLSGPYDMAVDAARRLLYVADFRTSVVRVVDLAGLLDSRLRPPGIIATIGAPRFRGSLR
jgi:DNA-binding beta-propeller fold protein YncE